MVSYLSRRLMIKTALICFGIFLILSAGIWGFILSKYPLDFEKDVPVVIAASDIKQGEVIELSQLRVKNIKESDSNQYLVADVSLVAGNKALADLKKGDYISSSILLGKKDWYKKDDRIIILPLNMEERLANLIKKGEYVDIRIRDDVTYEVRTVLSKVRVEDMLDDSGNSLSSGNAANSKTAYMKLVLQENQRQSLYTSMRAGKIIYELYCDSTQ
jgi:Flp pilus assembly protein CpaB